MRPSTAPAAGLRHACNLLLVFMPAMFAVLASLWPLGQMPLIAVCLALGCCALIVTVSVRAPDLRLAGVASLVLVISVGVESWPLRAAYALSRPSLDRVAERVRTGEAPGTPCRAGLFLIRKAEVYHNGVVCLWTDEDPAGPTGFVQTGPQEPPFNLASHIPLDESWQFISED